MRIKKPYLKRGMMAYAMQALSSFWPAKSGSEYTSYYGYANLTGSITINVPKSQKVDPLTEHMTIIVNMILDEIIKKAKDFNTATMVECWAALAVLSNMEFSEDVGRNPFSSIIMSSRVFNGSIKDQVRVYDDFKLRYDPGRGTAGVNLKIKAENNSAYISLIYEVSGNYMFMDTQPTEEDKSGRHMVGIFASAAFKSIYNRFTQIHGRGNTGKQ